ncbi:MAG: CpsD/CapB family tyrosine-protein kinase [Firmicutes bacterium]|nr:CpsD/CapB family tyrosine-protein kinase [Bacillota bacterium]
MAYTNSSKNKPSVLISCQDPKSPGTEAFGIIRTHLHLVSEGNPLRSILICSPGPREGRSIVAANLGISLARAGKNVILVDADMRRPTQHVLFSLPNKNGFPTLFTENADLDIAQKTRIPGLRVITGGSTQTNPSDILSSDTTITVIKSIASQADIVIYDTPPVTVVPDAITLGSRLDAALIVIRLGVTSRDDAKRTKELLELSRLRILGMIINDIQEKTYGSSITGSLNSFGIVSTGY